MSLWAQGFVDLVLVLVLVFSGLRIVIIIDPVKLPQEGGQLVAELMSVQWLQEVWVEYVLADVRLEDNENGSICHRLEQM